MDGCPSDRDEIVMRLHVNRGRSSAQQVTRVSVDSAGGNMHLLTRADDVSEQLEVRRVFDKATRDPAAGASTVVLFKEKLQVDLASSGDIIAVNATDASSKYFLLIPFRSKNPPPGSTPVHPDG